MDAIERYRIRVAHLRSLAGREKNLALKIEFERLARSYLRLIEQAVLNNKNDITYETPAPRRPDGESGAAA